MWNSLVGAVSGAANAVQTGIVGTGEKVPFSCQVPFKKFSKEMIGHTEFASLFRSEANALRDSPKWTKVEFTDPEGGDMKTWVQDQIGTYHLIKASFTIKKASNKEVLAILTGPKEVRAQYSADLAELETIASKDGIDLIHIAYSAPQPGSAGRDFVFLTSTAEEGEKLTTWGCSIDCMEKFPEDYNGYVRGACIYMWEVEQKGEDVVCTYSGCFDPRGWAPPFIISWFKTSATNEFCKIRKLCSKA